MVKSWENIFYKIFLYIVLNKYKKSMFPRVHMNEIIKEISFYKISDFLPISPPTIVLLVPDFDLKLNPVISSG